MTARPQTVDRGPLDADARGFLERYGAALAFPASGVTTPGEITAYLAGERARLRDTPGADVLRPNARAVVARHHVLADGVEARSYAPNESSRSRPVVVYLHGGGWVSGSIDLYDSTCRIIAAEAGVVVVNVGYRLAPEHPYPRPLDDCDLALGWVRRVAPELLGVDATRIAVVGSSAGGNLAAALALRARDRGETDIALQVLIYPCLDARMSGESHRADVNGRDYFISAEQMRWYWDQYRGDGVDADPYYSPLAAHDLASVAPAIVVTAEFDLLRDDGIRYQERLAASGVPSRRIHHPGQIHGFMALLDDIGEAYAAVADLACLIRDSFDTEEPTS